MSRRSLPIVSITLLLAFSSSACGLVFGGTRQAIRVSSTPTGASVTTNPRTSGYTTPASFSLQRNRSYSMTVSAPGYASQTVAIERSIRGGIVVLDIVLGIVPVIVDAATGAWYKLSPEYSTVVLERTTASDDRPDHVVVTIRQERKRAQTEFAVRAGDPRVHVSVSLAPMH